MDEVKRGWLAARLPNRELSDIVDCDPDDDLVVFADGRCRRVCEVWTRVMGYHRPVHAFNAGKQAEHQQREYFVERKD